MNSQDVNGPAAEGEVPAGERSLAPAPLEMTPRELEESRRYGRESLVCDLLDMFVDVGYVVVAMLFLAAPLDAWLVSIGWTTAWTRLLAFYAFFTSVHYAVSFPLTIYSGFILEHKFSLSKQSLRRWFARYLLRTALTMAFAALLIQGLYWTIWLGGWAWWLIATAATFIVSVILGQLVPVVVLPLFYKIDRLDDDEIMARLAELAEGTTLRIEGVYRMKLSSETVKANAMLTGLGRTRRVILGDTLLDQFSGDEIEVVFAHEVGHHVYRHMFKLMAIGLLTSGLGFLVCDLALRLTFGTPVDYASLPVRTLPMLTLVISLASMLVGPLQNAISRHFERQCDRYALLRTGSAAAYRSAFQKLARMNKADPDPHALEVFLFHDHPPIKERLALADAPLDDWES